jgi:hypothetical protein
MPTQPYKLIPDPEEVSEELMQVIKSDPKFWTGKQVRVPGTTTVVGRFKDSGALIYWANQEGLEGRPIRGEESTMMKAAEAGTLAHLMVENDIRGLPEPDLTKYPKEISEKATNSFLSYLEWKGQTKLKPVRTELALMSKKWLFGGTLDAVNVDGKLAILDWKTSGGIYEDMLIQVGGGYSLLWKENFPNEPIEGGYHIVRFSKVEADLAHHTWQNLEACEKTFKAMRILYELVKQVKERL